MDEEPVTIGVLALQGSFREHISSLTKLSGVTGVEVRTREQLASVDGLIIPGGAFLLLAGYVHHMKVCCSTDSLGYVQERAQQWR